MAELDAMVEALGNHPVSTQLALGDMWDGGDLWGSAMQEAFVLCDWLYFELGCGEFIPASMHYVPSLAPDDECYEWGQVAEMWPTSGLTAQDVEEYLRLLHIFLGVLKAQGLDY